MRCPKCGNELSREEAFCGQCGAPTMLPARPPETVNPPAPHTGGLLRSYNTNAAPPSSPYNTQAVPRSSPYHPGMMSPQANSYNVGTTTISTSAYSPACNKTSHWPGPTTISAQAIRPTAAERILPGCYRSHDSVANQWQPKLSTTALSASSSTRWIPRDRGIRPADATIPDGQLYRFRLSTCAGFPFKARLRLWHATKRCAISKAAWQCLPDHRLCLIRCRICYSGWSRHTLPATQSVIPGSSSRSDTPATGNDHPKPNAVSSTHVNSNSHTYAIADADP